MNTANASRTLTVTQLNEYIKQLLDSSPLLDSVYVKGEISNFTNHRTGHFYFTLKDEGALIKAVMFRSSASKLKFLPENGMRVLLHGRVTAFPRDGQYQIYADTMEPDGIGALYIAFEQLKKKLESEGLFAENRKRPLPKIPLRIGIITSPTGAAIRDMINILGRRFPMASITLFPSLVQGSEAPPQLAEGIRYFNSCDRKPDVIIIGRGGGSLEDLWAFNDEALARTVAASVIPVISAVGHETDFTICDFAADKRAPTPSAAAELAVPDTPELKRKINNITGRMELLLSRSIALQRNRLDNLGQRRVLTSPDTIIDDKRMRLLNAERSLEATAKLIVSERRSRYTGIAASLSALNPLAVLERGYAAVYDAEGTLIKSVNQLREGDAFRFRTTDGQVHGRVTAVEPQEQGKSQTIKKQN